MGIRETATHSGYAFTKRFAESSNGLRHIDPALRDFLQKFHTALPGSEPYRLDEVVNSRAIRDALGLNTTGIALLVKGARGLIDPALSRSAYTDRIVKLYDTTRMEALAALSWGMEQTMMPPYHTNSDVDWKIVGAYAKEALGDNPAAKHIHIEDYEEGVVKQEGEADEHYFDSIADPTLRDDLIQFEGMARPTRLAQMPVRRVVETIAGALGVSDPDMIATFRNVQENARDHDMLRVVPFGYGRDTNKYQEPKDILTLFILLRQRAKTPRNKQTSIANLAVQICTEIGEDHELYTRFAKVLPKERIRDEREVVQTLREKWGAADVYGISERDGDGEVAFVKKAPEPISPPVTREEAMDLLEGVPKERMRNLHQFLRTKLENNEYYVDFNRLERVVFPMVQLALRVRAIAREAIGEFDPELRGLKYIDAVDAVDIFTDNVLSEPHMTHFDMKQVYQVVEIMERQAKERA